MRFSFQKEYAFELNDWMNREWLETNGRGGYASGTLVNCHTRKYHGLLVSMLAEPPGTYVFLSQMEDAVTVDGQSYALVTHEYPGALYPDGYRSLTGFEQTARGVCFTFQCGPATVFRRLATLHGRDAVILEYQIEAPEQTELQLELRPLLACRSIHDVTRENTAANLSSKRTRNGLRVAPYAGLPPVYFRVSDQAAEFAPARIWYRNCTYRKEREREFESQDDLLSPGVFKMVLQPGRRVLFGASLAPLDGDLDGHWTAEQQRREAAAAATRRKAAETVKGRTVRHILQTLLEAGQRMVVMLPNGTPVVHGGYHWFGFWGRDALIALPGICFVPGRLDQGLQALAAFGEMENKGLLPNFVGPDGSVAYNAADVSLWYFWTVQKYLEYGGDIEAVRDYCWPVMKRILTQYLAGTENRIHTDAHGLLAAGDVNSLVSWMDVRIGQRLVIRRWGYLVELNALWYNALCFALQLKKRFKSPLRGISERFRDNVRSAFAQRFWLPGERMLADVVNGFYVDKSVRPNQLFALSLPYSPLSRPQQQGVLESIRNNLLVTDLGLRTLTPLDNRYQPICRGPQWIRELAYHQGSVRPWLIAHYADAVFRVEGKNGGTKAMFEPVLNAVGEHLAEAGLGGVSEIFEGDYPHAPQGAISQAWNIGEVIRLIHMLNA